MFQYSIFLLILVILQIIIAVLAFIYIEELVTASKTGFRVLWDNRGNSQGNTEAIDGIQTSVRPAIILFEDSAIQKF